MTARVVIDSFGKPPLRVGAVFAIRERCETGVGDRAFVHFLVEQGGLAVLRAGETARMATRANAQAYLDRAFCGERRAS